MVRIEEDRLVIEIKTCSKAEAWTDLYRGLLGLVREVNQETLDEAYFFAVIDLLIAMLPEYEDVKKMTM